MLGRVTLAATTMFMVMWLLWLLGNIIATKFINTHPIPLLVSGLTVTNAKILQWGLKQLTIGPFASEKIKWQESLAL